MNTLHTFSVLEENISVLEENISILEENKNSFNLVIVSIKKNEN